MFKFILKRIFSSIPTMLLIISLAFFLMRIAPGGPFDAERTIPPEIQANLEKVYNLDKSLLEQFWIYLTNIAQGDFGPSFSYKDLTVNELIAHGFPVTIQLGLSAMILSLIIGCALGIYAALNQNSKTDYRIMGFAMVGIAVPNFVMAPVLMLIFGVWLGWVRVAGWGEHWTQFILPTLVLMLPRIAVFSRMMRGSMLEVLHSNYVRTARAKGLSNYTILVKHCLRPALLPIITLMGPAMAAVLTGSIVIEKIFGIPGIGRYFVDGALNRDYTLVMGVVILYGFLIVLFNLIVDILYGFLDPKVKNQ